MRIFVLLLGAFAFAFTLSMTFASAEEKPTVQKTKTWGPATVRNRAGEIPGELDRLFFDLRTARNEGDSRLISRAIWLYWMRAPDEETAELMNRAMRAKGGYNFEKALGFLNEIIERHPGYAEAWNQRAYIHFLMKNNEKSLADCEKTLKLEPRHFGCMSGMARIMIEYQGRDEAGQVMLKKAMKLNPWLHERNLLK